MNETANSVGFIGLGALFATTIFLLVLVVASAKFFRWFKSAGFRFQDFEAHQDGDGVTLNSAFKRAGFEQKPRRGFTAPTAPAEPDTARFGPDTVLVAIATEDIKAGERVAMDPDKPGYAFIATATEQETGIAESNALQGKKVNIRVPAGRLLVDPIGSVQ